jgi:hypothetical protein
MADRSILKTIVSGWILIINALPLVDGQEILAAFQKYFSVIVPIKLHFGLLDDLEVDQEEADRVGVAGELGDLPELGPPRQRQDRRDQEGGVRGDRGAVGPDLEPRQDLRIADPRGGRIVVLKPGFNTHH